MVDFLEFMLLFMILIRWWVILIGIGSINYLSHLKQRKNKKMVINLLLVVVALMMLWAIYNISWYDFRLF